MIAILLLIIVCFLLSWYSNMPQPIQIITFICEALAILALILPFGVRLFPGW